MKAKREVVMDERRKVKAAMRAAMKAAQEAAAAEEGAEQQGRVKVQV